LGEFSHGDKERVSERIILCLGIAAILLTAFPVSTVEADTARYRRSIERLAMPDVVLVNQDGERVRFKALMESDKPVIVDFIFATCTTICPVLSAGFSSMQRKLGTHSEDVHLVSITIDPENDTPKIMKEYLERYGARPGWDFLTGSRKDIDRVTEAFDAFFGSKMEHLPLNFIRTSEHGKWIRLYGLLSSRDFMEEFQKAGVQ
jgi:protein SCO1/2